MMRGVTSLAFIIACVVGLSSCASIDVNSLPVPGNSYQGGYPLIMEFDNALNLPGHAKVTMDGRPIGMVVDVSVAGSHVVVRSRIDSAVSIPSTIHASLQQATVLGDIFVALERPAAAQQSVTPLAPGATIPLGQTKSPPQLEDTMAHLADFIGSGSIQRVQNTLVGLNQVTPPSNELRKLVSQFAVDISDLSNNINNVDLLLNGLSQTAEVLHGRNSSFQKWFTPEGMRAFYRTIYLGGYVSTALPSVGSFYTNGFWLVPLLASLADAADAVQKSKWAFESEVPKWRKLFTDYFLPLDKYPAINIASIIGPDGRELSGNVREVLRILGATP